jgi:hypothetical protein
MMKPFKSLAERTPMKKLSTQLILSMTILSLLGSCGKSTSDGSGILKEEEAQGSTDGSTIDGTYLAKFETLNPHVNGTIPGSLTLFRKGDRLMTYVRLFAGGPKVWHQQGIYMGKRCPTMADDTNGDGFIDIDEGMKVFGKMIIPLDANLNSQAAGRNFYPLADLSGYYHYERIASFKRMFSDLYEIDRDPDDHIVKLAEAEPFTFEGRVVVVQGVAETTALPETIAIQGRRRPFQTLPITCGIIKKVTEEPGTLDTGAIPGPVAPVEEGQDRPAPPEEDTGSAEGGTVSGTTGTNDTNDGRMGDGEGNETSGDSNGTTGGRSTGGRGETTGATTGGSTGGTTGRTAGGFIGGFIGGSSGGDGGSSGGSTGGETTGGSEGR